MSTDTFSLFAKQVAKSFQEIKDKEVFVADIDGDELYAVYIAAFPAGTNPIFKTKTEYECSCCRHFIRRAGAVITIENGKIVTVWDRAAKNSQGLFADVAASLRDVVQIAGVRDLFRVGMNEQGFGAIQTRSLDKDTQQAVTWNHLHTGVIPSNLRTALPDTAIGNYRTTVQVFERGLTELSTDAVATVISLSILSSMRTR